MENTIRFYGRKPLTEDQFSKNAAAISRNAKRNENNALFENVTDEYIKAT
jgi:hypothetical protein